MFLFIVFSSYCPIVQCNDVAPWHANNTRPHTMSLLDKKSKGIADRDFTNFVISIQW